MLFQMEFSAIASSWRYLLRNLWVGLGKTASKKLGLSLLPSSIGERISHAV